MGSRTGQELSIHYSKDLRFTTYLVANYYLKCNLYLKCVLGLPQEIMFIQIGKSAP
jgi:hypothetical protein